MPCPVMRGSPRFMPEGSGEFEVAGHVMDGVEVVVWAVRNGLFRRLAAGAHFGAAIPPKAWGRRRPSRLHLHRAKRRLPDGEWG